MYYDLADSRENRYGTDSPKRRIKKGAETILFDSVARIEKNNSTHLMAGTVMQLDD